MKWKRNKRKIEFITEEELRNSMEIDKFMDTQPDEIPKEYDLNWIDYFLKSPKRILKENGVITIKDEKE